MHRFFLTFLFVALAITTAHAESTEIVVHVRAQGSKFIGSSMSGVEVVLRNADTGEILAKGVTTGDTGDTERIMREKHTTNAVITTPDAARFAVTLDLDEPVRIRLTARGPRAQPQAGNEASATRWVVPGKHAAGGNAWLLVLPGLAVDILEPRAAERVAEGDVDIIANVIMNCGCPLTPGGLWDADTIEIAARITKAGELVETMPLEYAGEPSLFRGAYAPTESGAYEIAVYAYDPSDGNTGLDCTTFIAP